MSSSYTQKIQFTPFFGSFSVFFFFFSLIAIDNVADVALHLIHHGNIQSTTEKFFKNIVFMEVFQREFDIKTCDLLY